MRYTPVLVSMNNIQNRIISMIQGSTASSYVVTTDGILYAWGMLIYKSITVRLQWVW
jgi:alpha-tubulin suppressor-like RCC1 family protein